MDTKIGKTGVLRLVAVALVAFSLLIATAIATPTQAEAHQTAGSRTAIYVDGDLVKRTSDAHFAHSKILKPGCHNVKVVSREDSERVVQRKHNCVNERAKLTVTVNDGNVSSTVTTNY